MCTIWYILVLVVLSNFIILQFALNEIQTITFLELTILSSFLKTISCASRIVLFYVYHRYIIRQSTRLRNWQFSIDTMY